MRERERGWLRRARAMILRFCGVFGKQRFERELDEELESHLRLHIDDNLRAEMNQKEARREAWMKLGRTEPTKGLRRERGGLPILKTLWQDAGFAGRMLRKNLGFTPIARGSRLWADTASFLS